MGSKLLQINTVINSGSTGRIAEEIGQKAMSLGWESYIAYGRNDRPSKSHKIKIGNEIDLKWHGAETRLFDRHGFASVNATKKLIEQVKYIKPDIIHLHNVHGYYLNIDILFNYLACANVSLVWTLHDCWTFTGHCTHFSYIGCEKWKTHCESCPQKKEYPASYFRDRSYSNYRQKKNLFTSVDKMTIVGVSQWLSNRVSESFLSKFSNKVIHNGIDLSAFYPIDNCADIMDKYKIPRHKFILLGVAGVWSDRKGLADFVELSKTLEKDEIVVLVGTNKKIIRKLPSNIIGIERTENVNELAKLYSASEVLLNLTKEDSYPTINMEAIACGTPVITYNTGGSPESIAPTTGFVSSQGNLSEIRDRINEIKKIGKENYSNPCREYALANFDKDVKYNEYIQLYNNLLKQ